MDTEIWIRISITYPIYKPSNTIFDINTATASMGPTLSFSIHLLCRPRLLCSLSSPLSISMGVLVSHLRRHGDHTYAAVPTMDTDHDAHPPTSCAHPLPRSPPSVSPPDSPTSQRLVMPDLPPLTLELPPMLNPPSRVVSTPPPAPHLSVSNF